MRVLYVEHDAAAVDLTRRRLARMSGFAIDIASTVAEAIARLDAPGLPTYDLVLIEPEPPDDSGLALLRWIRERALPVAVVVITYAGDEETAITALKAGADDYVARRADYLDRLPLALQGALQRYGEGVARRAGPLRVIYAGHDADDVDVMRRHLARHAPTLQLETVKSGPDVLARLAPEREPAFDVVLLDCRLQDFNALEVLKELRQVRRLDVPVVLVTCQGCEDVAIQALKLGASGSVVRSPGYLDRLPGKLAAAVQAGEVAKRQEALRRSEERYRVFFEESPVGCSETDLATGRVLSANDALCAITGYTREELLRMTVRELTHPDDWPATAAATRRMISGESSRYAIEKRYVRKDGEVIHIRADASLVRDAEGRPLYGVTIIRDITDRQAAQEEIRQRDQLLQAIVRSLSAHVVVLDRTGTITYASRSWHELAATNRADLACATVGVDYLAVCRRGADEGDAAAATALAGIDAVMRGRLGGFTTEYPRPAATGDQWFLMHVNPMPPAHGGVVISHTDITAQKQGEAALAEQKTKYQEIFEGARVALWELDYTTVRDLVERLRAAGITDVRRHVHEHPELTREAMELVRVRDLNRHAVALHAAPSKQALLADPMRIVGAEMEQTIAEQIIALAEGQSYLEGEGTVRTWDGERRHVLYTATLVPAQRAPDIMLLSVIDITERKRAEQALRASEARYRTLVENQTELICRYLPDTTLTFVNDAYCRFVGRTREELIGTRFIDLVPEAVRAEVMGIVAGHGEVPRVSEHQVLRADGTVGWQQWVDRAFLGANGAVVELQGIGRDVSVQKRAEFALRESEEALRRSHDQIQDLAGRLISAQEEERKRISRELHDDLNQKIAALAIAISNLRRRLPQEATHLGEPLTSLQSRAIALANDVRRLSHDLHPAVLEHAGLGAALRAYCDKFAADSGVEVTLEVSDGLEHVPDDVALCLYRVTQEALRNTAKHSGSRAARVTVARRSDAIELAVCDAGAGFEVAETRARPVGIGLIGIGERVRLLRGSLDVRSAPGRGTTIGVRIPLAWSDR